MLIQESDLQLFGLLETKEAIYLSNKVNINFFNQIAWTDPFPYVDSSIQKKNQQNDSKKLNQSNIMNNLKNLKQIKTFAFPSKILLFKIMRACISIEKIDNLWIYNINDESK